MDVCESFAPYTMTMSIQLQTDNIHSSDKVHAFERTDLATLSSKSKLKPQAGTVSCWFATLWYCKQRLLYMANTLSHDSNVYGDGLL